MTPRSLNGQRSLLPHQTQTLSIMQCLCSIIYIFIWSILQYLWPVNILGIPLFFGMYIWWSAVNSVMVARFSKGRSAYFQTVFMVFRCEMSSGSPLLKWSLMPYRMIYLLPHKFIFLNFLFSPFCEHFHQSRKITLTLQRNYDASFRIPCQTIWYIVCLINFQINIFRNFANIYILWNDKQSTSFLSPHWSQSDNANIYSRTSGKNRGTYCSYSLLSVMLWRSNI